MGNVPRTAKGHGVVEGRPYAWWANWPGEGVTTPRPLVFPDQAGWEQFTDSHLMVAGFDATSRRRLIRETLLAAEETLERGESDRLEEVYRWWGTFCAGMLLRRLTQGGKRTWGATRTGRPGLLELLSDLERPTFVTKLREAECIWRAQRHAWKALQDFAVDVPAQRIANLQAKALRRDAYTRTRGDRPVAPVELHRRVAQVYRFYGIGIPVRRGSTRAWRLHPWRLWRIDHQFELYRDVRLASLDWLAPQHFVPYLHASQRPDMRPGKLARRPG